MNNATRAAMLCAGIALAFGSVSAVAQNSVNQQQGTAGGGAAPATRPASGAYSEAPRDVRAMLNDARVHQLLDRWQGVAPANNVATWREMMGIQLGQASPATLAALEAIPAAQDPQMVATNYDRFTTLLQGDLSSRVETMRAAHPKLLGDATQDLTFTPITPCRIVDTRNALGPIAAFTARNYYDWSNTSTFDWGVFQGGVAGASGTVCPQTLLGPGGQPAAVLMTVTVVNQAGPGTIVVWGGTSPVASASTLSYPATGFFANNTVVQVGGRVGTGPGGGVLDFGVYINAFTSAGVAVDVVGYFFPPQASALDCTTVTANGTAAANTDTGLAFPAAPSGYTKTGGYCYGAAFSPTGALLETGPNSCYFRNSSLATYAIHAIGTYCRTPGR